MNTPPLVQVLEPRQHLSVTLDNGLLTIGGTRRSDLALLAIFKGQFQVQLNSRAFIFDPGEIQRISIRTGRGDDRIFFGAFASARLVFPNSGGALNGNDLQDITARVTLMAGAGNDQAVLSNSDNRVLGGPGNDVINAGHGRDFVDGGGGDDVISSLGGDSTLLGGDGHDVIASGPGDDSLVGGPGDDTLMGGFGQDVLRGQEGDDHLEGDGDGAADMLIGGGGNDLIHTVDRKDRVFNTGNAFLLPLNHAPALREVTLGYALEPRLRLRR